MEKKEITILHGVMVWKSGIEYYNDSMFTHGYPYYRVTKIDEIYYLWELNPDNPDSGEYRIIKTCNDFTPLYDEGMALAEQVVRRLYPEYFRYPF